MLYITLQRKNKMDKLDMTLASQLTKENVFVSKELNYLIDSNNKNNTNSSFWFNAVLNDSEYSFEYISYEKKKNRHKIKGLCDCETAYKILNNESPIFILLMFKDSKVKKIRIKNIDKLSVKYKSENNYIVKYSIEKGDDHGI
tara:strand:+ start:881 stop:1309 length:429 start_codon:yes stop_codon:yes gene_type:complete